MIDAILLAYLFLYLIFYALSNSTWLEAHQKMMGVLAIFYLIYSILNIGQQWYLGYLYESISFYQRSIGKYYLWILIGQIVVCIIPALNLYSKNRKKLWLQLLMNGLIIGYLVFRYMLSNVSTTVIPGWYTTIYPTLNIYSLLIVIGLFLVIDFLKIKFISQ